MRKAQPVPVVLLMAVVAACAQDAPHAWGTINGRPIPATVFSNWRKLAASNLRLRSKLPPDGSVDEQAIDAEMRKIQCDHLHGAVLSSVRQQAVIDFGIVPGKEDLEEAARHVGDPDKAFASQREQTAALVQALSAVYDKGMAPDDAYRQMVASHGISPEGWKVALDTGSTAKGRAWLAQPLSATPQDYAKGASDARRSQAVWMRLDATVNEMIASSDPVFRTYINAWDASRRVSVTGSVSHTYNNPVANQYMDKKRAEWWRARLSNLQIVLSDPSLASTCHLAEMTGAEFAGTMTFSMR